MNMQASTSKSPHGSTSAGGEKGEPAGKILVWFFVLVFLAFGLLLFGDLLTSLWR